MAAARRKIITDADTGADDALSILIGCALADVLCIGCTDGNVTAAVATDNTLRLLEAAGLASPVATGLPWHSSEGRHWGRAFDDIFPSPPSAQSQGAAHQLLVREALQQPPCSLTLVCTGPLQNIGAAIAHAESLGKLDLFLGRFQTVVVMGGLCNPTSWDGELPSHAEFNIRADVDGSRKLWGAPWPESVSFVLVPIDPIARAPLLWDDVSKVEALMQTGSARASAGTAALLIYQAPACSTDLLTTLAVRSVGGARQARTAGRGDAQE